jgi:hypothetical protein
MTREEAIAEAEAGADQLRDALGWFETNDTDNIKEWERIHKHLALLAARAEELAGLPYGTLGGGGGGPKPPE